MASERLGDLKDLWTVASVILGFQITAFTWRMTRETGFPEAQRRFPPCEYLNLFSLVMSALGVFVLPLLRPNLAFQAVIGVFACSMILLGIYPFAVVAHYKLLFTRRGGAVTFCSVPEGILVVISVLGVIGFAFSYSWK
jgi:hypothetical protein